MYTSMVGTRSGTAPRGGRLLEGAMANGTLEQTIERIAHREVDPYSAVEELLEKAGL